MSNLIYVEAPDVEATFPMLFMAGGISDCWDWQTALVKELQKRPIIGTEYGYKRAMDVRVQTEQALDPGYTIYKEIPAMAKAIDKRVWEHMNWVGEGDL